MENVQLPKTKIGRETLENGTLIKVNEYLQLIINGLCTGVGGSIGSYLTLRLFIKHFEQIEHKLKNGEAKK